MIYLGATNSAVSTVFTETNIELLPNTGFSLQGVLDVLCTMWRPSGALKALKQALCWAKDNLMTAAGRQQLCELITNRASDILKGLAQAAGQKMLEWARISGISGRCAYCTKNIDVKDVLVDIGKAMVSAIGADGLNYVALVKNLGFTALAEAACCAIMLGVDAVAAKLPIQRAFAGLSRQCEKLLKAAGDKEVPGLSTAITFDFSSSTPSEGGSQVPPGTAQTPKRSSFFIKLRPDTFKLRPDTFKPWTTPPGAVHDAPVKSDVRWWPMLLTVGLTGGASWWIWRRRKR